MPSLNESLSALRAEKDSKRNPAWTTDLRRATSELRASGIVDRVLQVGARAPLFARPNLDGDTVRMRSLLQRGPVVVSFFRGRW